MCLNGERMISSVQVRIPKYETPILAEAKKTIETNKVETKIRNQVNGVKISTRFQIGEVLGGNYVGIKSSFKILMFMDKKNEAHMIHKC